MEVVHRSLKSRRSWCCHYDFVDALVATLVAGESVAFALWRLLLGASCSAGGAVALPAVSPTSDILVSSPSSGAVGFGSMTSLPTRWYLLTRSSQRSA